MNLVRIPLLFAILALAIVIGCDSEEPATPKCYANKGSSFTYTRTDKTVDGEVVAGTETTITAVVLESVHPFEGKDSVITVLEGLDTVRMAYESNGDVSVYGGLQLGGFPLPIADSIPKWWKLPTTSKGEVDLGTLDLNFNLGVLILKKVVGVADYKTTEEIQVGDQRLSSSKVEVAFTLTAEISSLPTTFNFTRTYWYCDKIGYFTQTDVHNDNLVIIQLPNYIQTLKTYTLVK